jgi:hypothetical protein
MRSCALSLWLLVAAAALCLVPAASAAVTIDWAVIGNPGNAADTPSSNCFAASCGSVSYVYQISKHEVTFAQYTEFLNAKAAADPLGLYNTSMTDYGVTRSGVGGGYSYTVSTFYANRPVNYVSFYDALRFANWLHNGQGSGDTEAGAYTLLGGTATPSNGLTVTRDSGARVFLPSENEWYKAAYYSSGGVYFDYPAGTDTPTVCATPSATPNTANCYPGGYSFLTPVGAYTGSASPYGTFDQGGNVYEWNEEIVDGSCRGVRGGSWIYDSSDQAASNPSMVSPAYESDFIGFRVASPSAPPPVPVGDLARPVAAVVLVMTGLLGIAYQQRWQGRTANWVRRSPPDACS